MCGSGRGARSEGVHVEDFDDFAVVREPARYVRRVGFTCWSNFGVDEFALAGDGNGDPFFLEYIVAHSEQVEPARENAFADQDVADVADGNDAAAAKNHAFDFWRAMRKAEDAAGSDEFRDVLSGKREATIAQAEQDERLELEFGGGHGVGDPIGSPG